MALGFILVKDPEPKSVFAPFLGAESFHFSQKQWVLVKLEMEWGEVERKGKV